MTSWQRTIFDSVVARGYGQGELTQNEYALKQLCKMVEEVVEYANTFCVRWASPNPLNNLDFMMAHLNSASEEAHEIFQSKETLLGITRGNWKDLVIDHPSARKELADVLVTIAMSAESLGVDVERIAVEKAQRDVERGVRT